MIPTSSEPVDDTVIASLQAENELVEVMYNTVKELPVTLDEIKLKAKNVIFIRKMKEVVTSKKYKTSSPAYSICDEVLLYAGRVVMPVVLQKRILKEFHQGHPGIGRMKALMRSHTYWPNMDKDIEQVVKTCKGCEQAAKAPSVKFTLWPKTDVPWTRLHIDYAGAMNGNYYLIVVDSFSKWPENFKCKRPTATVTKYFLTELFACFGVLELKCQ